MNSSQLKRRRSAILLLHLYEPLSRSRNHFRKSSKISSKRKRAIYCKKRLKLPLQAQMSCGKRIQNPLSGLRLILRIGLKIVVRQKSLRTS